MSYLRTLLNSHLIWRCVKIQPSPDVGQRISDEFDRRRGELKAAFDDKPYISDAFKGSDPFLVFRRDEFLFGVGPHRQLVGQNRGFGGVNQLAIQVEIAREIQTFLEFAASNQPFESAIH